MQTPRIRWAAIVLVALSLSAVSEQARAQGQTDAQSNDTMVQQITELRATVARLESALDQNHQGSSQTDMSMTDPASMKDQGGMGMMGKKSGMADKGMMGKMAGMGEMGMSPSDPGAGSMAGMGSNAGSGGMQGMGQGGMGMMGMMGDMGMMGKGGMKMGGSMTMPSALPGFPGASHIYHIGASGFFLDHDEHIELTTEQRTALAQTKEKALLTQNSAQRQIDEAEQELWELTAADEPDAAKIEEKIREIEKIRGDQRLDFVRAVGEAAKVLSPEQRKALLGLDPPQPAADPDAAQHQHPAP